MGSIKYGENHHRMNGVCVQKNIVLKETYWCQKRPDIQKRRVVSLPNAKEGMRLFFHT